jgi:hypothetical protein
MRERPILFSAPMICAIDAGEKTVTRRVVNPQPEAPRCIYDSPGADTTVEPYSGTLVRPDGRAIYGFDWRMTRLRTVEAMFADSTPAQWTCPYGAPGDRLWCRETWRAEELEDGNDGVRYAADNLFAPIANTPEAAALWHAAAFTKKGARRPVGQWRPSIFMPRWASRITLDVVSVRVERLHDIDEADAAREGVAFAGHTTFFTPRADFVRLWESINGKRASWAINPWVWRVEFKRAEVSHG